MRQAAQSLKSPALAALLVLAALLPGRARAGDAAELEILGFTADGRVFAFEQYGMQDGSGFPYAERFFIDTASDRYLPGTPIRVRLDENGTVAEARRQARARGETVVAQAELDANRGTLAAFNPPTELSADPFRLVASPRAIFPSPDEAVEFRLEELPFPMPSACPEEATVGFRLLRVDRASGGATQVIHEDKAVPASRGCALGYRIGGLQTFSVDSLRTYAVLISVRSLGFEGPDHRWIAVTGRF